jgi:hypothetical protein
VPTTAFTVPATKPAARIATSSSAPKAPELKDLTR